MTPRTLTPAAERITLLAMEQFAEYGYDAASLSDLAERAGMKKASLYAHFASKDALYEVTLERALQEELNYVADQFAQPPQPDAVPGERYISSLRERYCGHQSLRFLLRAAFYPPQPIRSAVMSGFDNYLAVLRSRFESALHSANPALGESIAQLWVEAYMAAVDSLNVELIYGNEQAYERRLHALQRLLRGISAQLLGRCLQD